VVAISGGGQISFGEAAGSIEARTGGGGIRVQRIAGPTQLQTVAGSIYLAGIQSQVRAVTSAGSITAYFASEAAGKKRGPSELECQQGDIEVYLPPGMALNIEAVIENATYHKVLTDPSLAAKVSDAEGAQGTRLRQEVSLNGGGELLRLRTVAGNILLLAAGSAEGKPVFRYVPKQMIELQEQHLRAMQAEIQRQVQEQIREKLRQEQEAHSRLNAFIQEQLRFLFARPLMVSGEEQSRKLEYQVKPRYPSAARRERIEGTVQLEAHVAEDGTVEKVRVLEGDPVLAEAAREAVMKWRYKPTLKNGKPVKVVTRVAVEFRMAK
jgi:protein TonB